MTVGKENSNSQQKKIELILRQLHNLPTLPAVAARVLQITASSDSQAAEVIGLIESDPALTSKIVAMATRVGTGMNRATATVNKAVMLLGFDAVRNAALSIKVFETLGQAEPNDLEVFDRVGFWKHSLAVACAARVLIKHIDRKVDPEEAFLCGLLHDIGKVALDACLPKSFARVVEFTDSSLGNIADAEQKVLGIDHAVVGKRLAQRWHLPEDVLNTIWLHHHGPESLPDQINHRSIVQTVHLADLFARQQRIGYSGNHTDCGSIASVAEKLGCSAQVMDQLAQSIRQAVSDRAEMLGLNAIEPEQLYHEALGQANGQLGKLNTRLERQNEQLQLRSEALDLISQFNDQLHAEHSVADVCALLVKLWVGRTGSVRCAAYAVSTADQLIEGAVTVDRPDNIDFFLIDRADLTNLTSDEQWAAQFPAGSEVALAGPAHLWFFEQVAAAFDADKTLAMPLRAGNELTGAILWEPTQQSPGQNERYQGFSAFAANAALALRQAQRQEAQTRLCEQLAQASQLLQQSQQELLHKRALAAVGEMACGAAHEINNPLAVVVGRSELLASSEDDSGRTDMLQAITRAGQDISDIVTQLLEVAQPAQPQLAPVDVSGIISAAVDHCAEQARQAGCSISPPQSLEDLPEVFVDSEQTCAIITELISNAIDSYRDRSGSIDIVGRHDELNGDVIVEVIDHGCGMDTETAQKAFAPFFSAHSAGRRRGLGLSRALRSAQSNGGNLLLRSQPDQGTVAQLILPVAQIEQSSQVAAQ